MPSRTPPSRVSLPVLCLSLAVGACAGPPPPASASPAPAALAPTSPPATAPVEAVPLLRLPTDTRPVAEALELRLDPRQETYSGAVDIDVTLDAARATLWLHGKGLNVARATVTPEGGAPLDATWQDRHDSGVASLTVARAIPPGRARIHVEYGAAFNRGQHGLYRAREADVDYVFTQFEAIAAREAFPCFDEPAFKIPFTTTLVVPDGQVAIANTHEASRAAAPAGWTRVAFAPSLPLPSYLVAFAVGPFDLVPAPDVPPNEVRARPLPLRAVTARGRARDVAYALAHAGEILATLERYVGLEYPYDKLDLVAVPGKGSAMENPGCVTFDETRLLMDGATASVSQRRSYAGVMAHELAHQWTGDLVTMEWWNDVWLNEAFATWLGTKATDAWDPKSHAGMALLRSAQDAMSVDSLVSARSIRQPITSTHDIANAFDAITYRKGGAVLGMFERWVGEAAWQKGLHAYLSAHRFGSGTADDFLQAENDATGKDVRTAFHTFLDQPGVPFVEARVACDQGSARVALRQSRFLPVGSTGDADATWQIPVCVRTGEGTTCTLLASTTGELALPGACPAFVFPNADAAGYYRFSLAAADLDRLRRNGIPTLSEREKLAYGASLRAAWARATTPMQDVMRAAEPLAADAEPAVAEQPMGYVTAAREWLWSAPARANVEVYARSLYEPVARRLGWEPKAGEDDEARALRGSVLTFLALTARDAPVRAEARKRGLAYLGVGRDGALHADAVDANLAAVAVAVVGEEADRATWDAMRALFAKTVDEVVRGRLLRGMSLASDPTLASAARELMLDPTLRDSETLTPLFVQLGRAETRDVAWAWMKEHYDAILARMPRHHGGTQLVGAVSVFCDEEHAGDIERFFAPKAEALEGGPRALASTLEEVRLCAARRKAQEPSARAMFARQVTLRRATSF